MASLFDSVNRFFGIGREERMERMAKESKSKPKKKTQPDKKESKKKRSTEPLRKLKGGASGGLAAKLRDKSKKEIEKQGG